MRGNRDAKLSRETGGKADLIRSPSNVISQATLLEVNPSLTTCTPPILLTILECSDVERLAAVVSRPDSGVRLHHDAVLCVLPQVCDVDEGGQ